MSDPQASDHVSAINSSDSKKLSTGPTSSSSSAPARGPAGVKDPSLLLPLAAGGFAGTAVDVALFPLDTLKTRMQTKVGFRKAGGFKGVYAGLGPAALGSAPNAAIFFLTYEAVKRRLAESPPEWQWLCHSTAASLGETVSCIVRVPVENVKQKMQVDTHHTRMTSMFRRIWNDRRGPVRGFYTGFASTVAREVPFAFIQFPIYEHLKKIWAGSRGLVDVGHLGPLEGALCGSVGGCVAAGLTTPLDVVKTRLMTAGGYEEGELGMARMLAKISKEEGWRGLFRGIAPRMAWISLGGFVFFGSYEGARTVLGPYLG